jgi:hydrogenase/urease accessory protein HupE
VIVSYHQWYQRSLITDYWLPITNPVRFFIRLLCALLVAASALAHDPGLSTATVRLQTNRMEVALGFSLTDAAELVEIDRDHDGKASREELELAAAELKKLAPEALEVAFNEKSVQPTEIRSHFDDNENANVDLVFPAPPFTQLVIRSKWLALFPPGHRQFLSLQNPNGQVLAERLLSANADTVTVQMDPVETPSAAQSLPSGSRSFYEFLRMGIEHIWTGYDHLLFLFGLLIVTGNFKSSFTIITFFTIAHSITLALATLNLVPISSKFVEPMIAASIVYVGVENLWRGGDPKGRWLLTFGFGLIHGFGFASVLRDLGVGAHGSGIAVPLVSFNLGVEVGQVAVAAVLLPLIWKLRTIPVFLRRWVPACSIVIVVLGAYLLVERVWTIKS